MWEKIKKNKLWRVPFVSIAIGIIETVLSAVFTFVLVKVTTAAGSHEWTEGMTIINLGFSTVISLVLFIAAGLLCFKDMNVKDIIKSGTIVFGYAVVLLIIEQLIKTNGVVYFYFALLFSPINAYTGIFSLSLLINQANISTIILIASSLLMPFAFILFKIIPNHKNGKQTVVNKESN